MAEALAIFGLAANIMQFLDFGSKIVSASRGSDHHYLELDIIATDLERAAHDLQSSVQARPSGDATQNDIMLQRLAIKCRDVCHELLQVLGKLQAHSGRGGWRTFHKALMTVWNEGQVNALHKKMDDFRQEFILRILMSLRYYPVLMCL